MERYKNLAGDSGVRSFEILNDEIVIEFVDGSTYLYNETRPGRRHVENMKDLARTGKGLASYINRYVRENYAKKIK